MDDQPRGHRDHHWKLDQVERKGDMAQEPGQRREEAARGPVGKSTNQEQDGEHRLGLAGTLPAMTFIGGDHQKNLSERVKEDHDQRRPAAYAIDFVKTTRTWPVSTILEPRGGPVSVQDDLW